jgi:hypothetical protein
MNGSTRDFTAGALQWRLDAETGMVRAIRFHGHEVLRAIYPAVRDASWGTVTPTLSPASIESPPA